MVFTLRKGKVNYNEYVHLCLKRAGIYRPKRELFEMSEGE